MKKVRLWIILSAFVILFSVVVSAQIDLERGANQIITWIKDIFSPFFEALLKVENTEFLFAKILLMVLLLIIVYIILDKIDLFGDNKALITIISVIVSLLAVRYLPETSFVTAILLPYSVLGVALLSFIPLLIYFFFVESIDNSIMRKIAWCLYAAIFIGLWFVRREELGTIALIYLLAAVLAILFLIFDKTIRTHLILSSIERGLDADKVRAIVDLKHRIAEDRERLKYATTRWETKRLKENVKMNKKKLRDIVRL